MGSEEPPKYKEQFVETTVIWEYRSGAGDLVDGGVAAGGGSGLDFIDTSAPPVGGGGSAPGPPADVRIDDYFPDGQPDDGIVREREVGTTTAPDGSTVTYVINREFNLRDGTSSWSRSEPGSESYGNTDAAGNSSLSERNELLDGTVRHRTRTEDASHHGTEHVTWVDADGNIISDETTEF